MHVVRAASAPPYDAPGHIDVRALRLQSAETTGVGFCSVGLSFYAPGGRAEMAAGPQEKLYVVLSGQISVHLATGEPVVLGPHDSCLIEPDEMRAVYNETDSEAVLLVITPPAAAPTSG